jgi:polyphosphate kinase
MTREQVLENITHTLASFDDARVITVQDILQEMAREEELRVLSERELSQIEQSKEDFRLGRTMNGTDVRAAVAAALGHTV